MIKGVIHKNRPLIKLRVGSYRNIQEIVVLVDTGFTGELKLSEDIARRLDITTTHMERVLLADEKELQWKASFATVDMEGLKQSANVLIGEGKLPIIGIGLLRRFHYNFQIELKHDLLTLERY